MAESPCQDLVHGAAALHAGVELLGRLVAVAGIVVALLDQQPVLPAAILLARLHAHQHVVAVQPVAVQAEFEIALGETLVGVADRLPRAVGPRSSPGRRHIRPWGSRLRSRHIRAGGPRSSPRAASAPGRGSGLWSRPSSSARRHARAGNRNGCARAACFWMTKLLPLALRALRPRLRRLAEVALRLVLGKQVSRLRPAP